MLNLWNKYFIKKKNIWVRSRNCGCLVTWFCYQMITKPGNKTATPSWPDPYLFIYLSKNVFSKCRPFSSGLGRFNDEHGGICWFNHHSYHNKHSLCPYDKFMGHRVDGLVQDCSDSCALIMELLQPCAKPSICRCLKAICVSELARLFGATPLPEPMLIYCYSGTNFVEIWI